MNILLNDPLLDTAGDGNSNISGAATGGDAGRFRSTGP